MLTSAPELKRVASEVVGSTASTSLMKRIFTILDEATDPKVAVVKVEKVVALFLGADEARALASRFDRVLGQS